MALRPARLSGVDPYAHEVQPRDARVDVPERDGPASRDGHRHISREVQPALSVGGMPVPHLLQASRAAASREALPPESGSLNFAGVPRRLFTDCEASRARSRPPTQHCVQRDVGDQFPRIQILQQAVGIHTRARRSVGLSLQDRDDKRSAPLHAGASRSVGFRTPVSSDNTDF